MTMQVTVEVPAEAFRAINVTQELFSKELLEAAVLRWFEEGRLSQGQAATMLGLSRGEFFDILLSHRVSPIQLSAQDLEEEFRRA